MSSTPLFLLLTVGGILVAVLAILLTLGVALFVRSDEMANDSELSDWFRSTVSRKSHLFHPATSSAWHHGTHSERQKARLQRTEEDQD
jgi:type IV secretory pathway VirB3-like protein